MPMSHESYSQFIYQPVEDLFVSVASPIRGSVFRHSLRLQYICLGLSLLSPSPFHSGHAQALALLALIPFTLPALLLDYTPPTLHHFATP